MNDRCYRVFVIDMAVAMQAAAFAAARRRACAICANSAENPENY